MNPPVDDPDLHLKKEAKKKKKSKKRAKKMSRKEVRKIQNEDSDPLNVRPKISEQVCITGSCNSNQQEKLNIIRHKNKNQPNAVVKVKNTDRPHNKSSSLAQNPTEDKIPRHSFPVDDTDHCETPLKAYQDVVEILDKLASSMHKRRCSLTIYDPYYCDGGVKKKLASFGFTSVINRNRDFYQDIANETIPEYDVLVTNPPYSGVHIERILAFCSNTSSTDHSRKTKTEKEEKKPFLLLLPHFVYTKEYYNRALSQSLSSAIFFLIPEIRYSYIPPSWVSVKSGSKALEHGKTKTAPFPSFWYCYIPNELISNSQKWLLEQFGPSGMIRPRHKSRLRYARNRNDIPRDFRGEFDPNRKRANPKARKRAAKRRREAAASARTT